MARIYNLQNLYSRLVGLYPAAYRRRYGQPMVQTFDDMLQAEPTTFGKLNIWARALWDLPGSLVKEHLTNGKGIYMSRNFKIFLAGVVAVLLLANGASYWFGILHARQANVVEKVTATQLADAMQQDDFYSIYGQAAVLFKGKAVAVQNQGDTSLVTFQTGHAYSLQCEFSGAPQIHIGQSLSVAAPGGSADRLAHGVRLHNCLLN